jgi:hypothetical protein
MEAQTDSWTDRRTDGRTDGETHVVAAGAWHQVKSPATQGKKPAQAEVRGHNRVLIAIVLAAVEEFGFVRARDETAIVTRLILTLICPDPVGVQRGYQAIVWHQIRAVDVFAHLLVLKRDQRRF